MVNADESSPLLGSADALKDPSPLLVPEEKAPNSLPPVVPEPQKKAPSPAAVKWPSVWTADGVPVGRGDIFQDPDGRVQWNSGLFTCLGRNDEFCSSDLEVCLLGCFAPCVLYGSNAEWFGAVPGTFADNCLPYAGLYLLGNALFGCNCLAPWFSHPSRTMIRQKFNLEGSFEAFTRSCGCCRGAVEDDLMRAQLERVCDFATHCMCHPCSLCQEGRELRRRLPHPGFGAQPVYVMMPPPMEQAMSRGA